METNRKLLLANFILILLPSSILALGGVILFVLVLMKPGHTFVLLSVDTLIAIAVCLSVLAVLSLWALFMAALVPRVLSVRLKKILWFFSISGGVLALFSAISMIVKSLFGFAIPEIFHVGQLFFLGIPLLVPLIHYWYYDWMVNKYASLSPTHRVVDENK